MDVQRLAATEVEGPANPARLRVVLAALLLFVVSAGLASAQSLPGELPAIPTTYTMVTSDGNIIKSRLVASSPAQGNRIIRTTITDPGDNVVLDGRYEELESGGRWSANIVGYGEFLVFRPLEFVDNRTLTKLLTGNAYHWGFIYYEATRLTDDEPGCDWFPDGVGTTYCCAFHDQCYQQNGCTASSWLSWPWTACQGCNGDVLACLAANPGPGIPGACGLQGLQHTCYNQGCMEFYCAASCSNPPPAGGPQDPDTGARTCGPGESYDWTACVCIPQ